MYHLSLGDVLNENVKRIRAEDQRRGEKIEICSEMLKCGDISVAEFLKMMANRNTWPKRGSYHIYI